MEVKKVLFVSQEIDPYVTTGELALLSRRLPIAIQEQGAEVRTFMPRYGAINERRNQLHEVIRLSGMNIVIDDCDHPLIIKVATLQPSRMQVYFIDNDDYFLRHNAGGPLETQSNPEANDERAVFYVRGTVETVKKLRWEPQIVHCMGWLSALTPLFLKTGYADDPSFRNSKIVYSLLPDAFEKALDPRFAEKLIMDGFTAGQVAALADTSASSDYVRLSKLAMDYADAIAVTAPGVSPELVEYARATGKPLLEEIPQDEQLGQTYYNFYKSL